MPVNDPRPTHIGPTRQAGSAPRVIIVMGVSGSGKTEVGRQLAATLGASYRDADDLHPPENVDRMRAGIPLTDADREPWLAGLGRLTATALAEDGPVLVLACSALKRRYRRRLHSDDPRVVLVHLAGPAEVIRKRLEARTGHYMPASLLESQLATLEPPGPDEHPIVIDVSAPAEAIVSRVIAELAADEKRRSVGHAGP